MEGLSLLPALGNRLPILYPSTIPLYARLALSHNPHRRDYRLPYYHFIMTELLVTVTATNQKDLLWENAWYRVGAGRFK